jgi:predicted glycosyltransferase involved in capsule biosynthesis
MGRREHLEMTLPLMLEEFGHVIVVDWSCPQDSGKWAAKEGAEVIFRKGEKYFSASKARNLGARQVKTRSVCFIDADVLVSAGIQAEIARTLNLSTQVIASRDPQNNDVHALGGFIAVDIGQFWGVGGYDESLQGYALEDVHLRARLLLERGVLPKRLSPAALAVFRHSNEMRGRYFEESVEVTARRNHARLMQYLATHGVTDWVNDPRTADIAYRV